MREVEEGGHSVWSGTERLGGAPRGKWRGGDIINFSTRWQVAPTLVTPLMAGSLKNRALALLLVQVQARRGRVGAAPCPNAGKEGKSWRCSLSKCRQGGEELALLLV